MSGLGLRGLRGALSVHPPPPPVSSARPLPAGPAFPAFLPPLLPIISQPWTMCGSPHARPFNSFSFAQYRKVKTEETSCLMVLTTLCQFGVFTLDIF